MNFNFIKFYFEILPEALVDILFGDVFVEFDEGAVNSQAVGENSSSVKISRKAIPNVSAMLPLISFNWLRK